MTSRKFDFTPLPENHDWGISLSGGRENGSVSSALLLGKDSQSSASLLTPGAAGLGSTSFGPSGSSLFGGDKSSGAASLGGLTHSKPSSTVTLGAFHAPTPPVVAAPVQARSSVLHAPIPPAVAAPSLDSAYVTMDCMEDRFSDFHMKIMVVTGRRAAELVDDTVEELKSILVSKEEQKTVFDGINSRFGETVPVADYNKRMEELYQFKEANAQLVEHIRLANVGLGLKLDDALKLQEERNKTMNEEISELKAFFLEEIGRRDTKIQTLEEFVEKAKKRGEEIEKLLELQRELSSRTHGDVTSVIAKIALWEPCISEAMSSGGLPAGSPAGGSASSVSLAAAPPSSTAGGGSGPAPAATLPTASGLSAGGVASAVSSPGSVDTPASPTSSVAGTVATLPVTEAEFTSTAASASIATAPPPDSSASSPPGASGGGSAPPPGSSASPSSDSPSVSAAPSGSDMGAAGSSPESAASVHTGSVSTPPLLGGGGGTGTDAAPKPILVVSDDILEHMSESVVKSFVGFLNAQYFKHTKETAEVGSMSGLLTTIILRPRLRYTESVGTEFSYDKALDPNMLFSKERIMGQRIEEIVVAVGGRKDKIPGFWKKNWPIVVRHCLFYDGVSIIKAFKDDALRARAALPAA